MKLLERKKVLITGATRGIGFAIAKRFAEEGADLALSGTRAARGEEVVRELSAYGGVVKFYAADLSDRLQVQALADTVLQDFEQLDVVVNNAGVTRDQLLMKMSDEEWCAVIETNLSAIFYLCRALIRPMLKARKGKIINISSVVGLMGNAGQTNYAAAKAGIIGWSKALAREVAGRGITVNCVAPGFINTDMTGKLTDVQKELLLKQIPLGRLGEPDDVASLVLFLASAMADYITGQVITVDGGMVMG